MQNLTTAASAEPGPPAEKGQSPTSSALDLAEARIRSACSRAGDETVHRLDWNDRDTICRDLADALRFIREAREAASQPAG